MEIFLASDVIYSQRVAPLIQQALDDDGISGQHDRRPRTSCRTSAGSNPDAVAARISARTSARRAAPNATARARHARPRRSLGVSVGGDDAAADAGGQPRPGRRRTRPSPSTFAEPGRERRDQRQGHRRDHRRAASRSRSSKTIDQTKAGTTAERRTSRSATSPPSAAPLTIDGHRSTGPRREEHRKQQETYPAIFAALAASLSRPCAGACPRPPAIVAPRRAPGVRAGRAASSRAPSLRPCRLRRLRADQRVVLGEHGAARPRRARRASCEATSRRCAPTSRTSPQRLDARLGGAEDAPRRRDRLPRAGPLRRLQRDVRPPVDVDRAARRRPLGRRAVVDPPPRPGARVRQAGARRARPSSSSRPRRPRRCARSALGRTRLGSPR